MSKNQAQKDEKVIEINAYGNDRNLAKNGNNVHYWYSIADGCRLLLWIWKHHLHYTDRPTITGEEHTAFRENNNRILITDPYYGTLFSNYLNDDIARITATNHFAELTRWEQMPTTIIIPLLAGLHWRTIKVNIVSAEQKDFYHKFQDDILQDFGISLAGLDLTNVE